MHPPPDRIDGFLIAVGFTVSAIWLFKRQWLEQTPSHRHIQHICIVLAAVGAYGVLRLILGARTFLHCLIFPLPILYIHDWLFRYFCRRVGRAPEDTFLRWGRGLEPDYIYNSVFGVIAFVGPLLGAFLPYIQANKT